MPATTTPTDPVTRRAARDRDDLCHAVRRLGIDPAAFADRVRRLVESDGPRYRRMWGYYRNPARLAVADGAAPAGAATASGSGGASARPYRQAQEWGLPRRITGGASVDPLTGDLATSPRREVVVENDIAWRIDAMVDFLFGRPVAIRSAASDPARAEAITSLLRQVVNANGGPAWQQQLALIGAVYGSVDVLVKLLPPDDADALAPPVASSARADHDRPASPEPAPRDEEPVPASPSPDVPSNHLHPGTGASDSRSRETGAADDAAPLARRVRLEVVDPARALPLLDPNDHRVVRAYAQVYAVDRATDDAGDHGDHDAAPREARWWQRWFAPSAAPRTPRALVVELITPTRSMTFRDGRLVASGENTLGRVPLAHVQNVALPFEHAGASDVEPLMPLQDELNTRLSDRAHRITMQSFRMYLGKGIEQFTEQPVAPGRMWMTDNPDAQILEFGGDAACPSEDAHVREIREAMDKVSGVTPIAAGILKNRIGRLTSGAALRVTMLALLARTERKRLTYGDGLARICELALAWLDHAGLFRTTPDERQVVIDWSDPVGFIDSQPGATGKA